ncbi:MAG: hypothetical protein E4G94_04510 [ANME-2 cluster archaeon]|nr:MAG: hypothetical protein E4G94_04510 [ANME-2 cluster archaeon]
MNLTPQETGQLEYLLGKSKFSFLTQEEKVELRSLITKEQPSAEDSSLDDLINLVLIIIGLYILAKAIGGK